ncbi:class I SAM-dependent DNA methyltransferase [uncultured Halomonas sp.]|uniref:type I restriction-modification system subunit M n=1 Tax=uncultured Halomonas sp. TaxID=173971 RepID=UPI0026208A8C|nr:class I SAM-dependent DNA methyltransferase [uncultured Halomonas sp.]
MATNSTTLADFIWKNADDLWGPFKHTDFGKVILPFTLLRRLECVLEPTQEEVKAKVETLGSLGIDMAKVLPEVTGVPFYNTSDYSLATLGSTQTRSNLEDYIAHFSEEARRVFEQFNFTDTLARLDKAGLLYKICQNFAEIDLHPDVVPARVMSNVYEHLIRRFGAAVNEAAEDFMTPRDVVHLATAMVIHNDIALFEQNPGIIRTLYDPTCGTGGFLSDAIAYVESMRHRDKVPPKIVPFGQEVEPETHAFAMTGMMIQGYKTENIKLGNTLSDDQLHGRRFHYGLSNPPFGKKWENEGDVVEHEHEMLGYAGRFGPGLPRKSDGSMLFLMHLVSKMERPEEGGGRAAIVLSGSPLFNGNAGSGESEIRRYLLENDYVDAIVALPTDIFFRTGIGTYLWVLDNHKPEERKGKVQLIDATEMYRPMRKPEGNKRREIGQEQYEEILRIYDAFEHKGISKIMDYREFGYRRIKVLRPMRKVLHINPEGLERLQGEKAWAKLTETKQQAWLVKLEQEMGNTHPYHWADTSVEYAVGQAVITKAKATFINAIRKSFEKDDPEGDPVLDKQGNPKPDTDLTDYEQVPLDRDVRDYFAEEVLPHVPDAFLDETFVDKQDGRLGKVGYEINFNRYFYQYQPPRPLEAIDTDLNKIEAEIREILDEVTE